MDLFSSEEITSLGHSPIFFSCLTFPVVTVWISSLHPIHVLFFVFTLTLGMASNVADLISPIVALIFALKILIITNSITAFHLSLFNLTLLPYLLSSRPTFFLGSIAQTSHLSYQKHPFFVKCIEKMEQITYKLVFAPFVEPSL